jgi:transcriptional regulator GlxA family with amidase domain
VKLAFVIYDQFTLLDLAGPLEVLRGWPSAQVSYVASSVAPVTTDSGVQVQPTATIDQLRDPDVVLVPGTGRPDLMLTDDALTGWLRTVAETAQWMASVCTGAGLLAAAGLLRGRRATTHWAYRTELAAMGVEVVDERVVFDGRIVTAAGASAGIDMALALIGRELGPRIAKVVQLAIEYDPQPPYDSGSPAKAGAEITSRSFALLAAARAATVPATMTAAPHPPPDPSTAPR